MLKIQLDHEKLSYMGRIDRIDPQHPVFVYPATCLRFCFYGKKAVLTIENFKVCYDNYVGAFVDGKQYCFKLNDSGNTEIVLLDECEEAEHDVLFFKRQDCVHEMQLLSLELSENSILRDAPAKPERRIEVYGDSVSAGEVAEALDYIKKPDPIHQGEYSNSWYSYSWIAARKMNAQLHDIAQGGIPLLNGNGWVSPPYYPGMEFMWDKVHYSPQLGKVTDWNFEEYTPHLVLVAIGQNDSNPDDYMKTDTQGLRAVYWKYKYECLIRAIRKKYPKALILLTTTILEHDLGWDHAIEEVCCKLQDPRIRHFLYSENGCGTPGHVRIPEAEKMAEELAAYIQQLEIPVWDD